jgi:hypothetical protein
MLLTWNRAKKWQFSIGHWDLVIGHWDLVFSLEAIQRINQWGISGKVDFT